MGVYRYSRFDEWLGKREWSTEGRQIRIGFSKRVRRL